MSVAERISCERGQDIGDDVGYKVAQGAKQSGAANIIGVDNNGEKCDQAKAFGVTQFVNPNDHNEPIQQVIKDITDGGADYAFECICDTGAVTTALQSLLQRKSRFNCLFQLILQIQMSAPQWGLLHMPLNMMHWSGK